MYSTGLAKLPSLMRFALIGAAAFIMPLMLAACGSEPPPAPAATAAPAASAASQPASPPAAESDTIKVGILH